MPIILQFPARCFKNKTIRNKKTKPTTTKLKVEKLVVKEEPLLKEEPVLEGRRKAAKSETKADKSVSDSTIQSKVPVKRRRRS